MTSSMYNGQQNNNILRASKLSVGRSQRILLQFYK